MRYTRIEPVSLKCSKKFGIRDVLGTIAPISRKLNDNRIGALSEFNYLGYTMAVVSLVMHIPDPVPYKEAQAIRIPFSDEFYDNNRYGITERAERMRVYPSYQYTEPNDMESDGF